MKSNNFYYKEMHFIEIQPIYFPTNMEGSGNVNHRCVLKCQVAMTSW